MSRLQEVEAFIATHATKLHPNVIAELRKFPTMARSWDYASSEVMLVVLRAIGPQNHTPALAHYALATMRIAADFLSERVAQVAAEINTHCCDLGWLAHHPAAHAVAFTDRCAQRYAVTHKMSAKSPYAKACLMGWQSYLYCLNAAWDVIALRVLRLAGVIESTYGHIINQAKVLRDGLGNPFRLDYAEDTGC